MNGQDPPCLWQGYTKVDGSGPCTIFMVSDFLTAWTILQTLSQRSSLPPY